MIKNLIPCLVVVEDEVGIHTLPSTHSTLILSGQIKLLGTAFNLRDLKKIHKRHDCVCSDEMYDSYEEWFLEKN